MKHKIDEDKIKKVCEGLNIPYAVGSLPPIETIKDKLQNVLLDDTAPHILNRWTYEMIESAFIFGIIYGANYR